MNIESSTELQDISLSTLLKNVNIYAKVKDYITEAFFEKIQYKLIYKSLKYFYSKYTKLPTLQELVVVIIELHEDKYGNISEIKQMAMELYAMEEFEPNFITEKLVTFIRRNMIESTFKDLLPKVQNGESVAIDSIGAQLAENLNIEINTRMSINLADTSSLARVREEAVGTTEQPTIIKSCIPGINNCLTFKGYKSGDFVLFVGAPGCFTGDTKLMLADGTTKTIDEIKDDTNIGLYTCDKSTGKIMVGKGEYIHLSKYTDDLVEVEIDYNHTIKCTPDHPFLLRSGEYVQAKDLTPMSELMPITRRAGIKSGRSEYVVDCNGNRIPTHRTILEYVDHSIVEPAVHHIDLNHFNNHPDNLQIISSSEHTKLHNIVQYDTKVTPWVEAGVSTRITSEVASRRNKENWKNADYRERMSEVSRKNGKSSKLVTEFNHNDEFQHNTRKCRVLSFINKLLLKHDNITIDNYDELASSVEGRKVLLTGVAKAYDCCLPSDKPRRYWKPDLDKLSSIWRDILEDARVYNHKVTKVTRLQLNEKVPVYGIVEALPHHNYALALTDDTGIFVSNTGKTMFMVNELSNCALQGFNALHVFLGDMTDYDGVIRYTSRLSTVMQDEIVAMTVDEQAQLIQKCNYQGVFNRIECASYAADELTIDQLINEIYRIQKDRGIKFDMIAIDYPDNLRLDGNNMYKDGGDVYNRLSMLARNNKSVVIAGSQPKIQYWGEEIIPKEAAAESSKKQHVVDLMVTSGKPFKGATYMTYHIAKVRRGNEGRLIRVKSQFERAYLEQCSEQDYLTYKAENC